MVEQRFIEVELQRRRTTGELRQAQPATPESGPYVRVDDRRLVDFSSNDYLGLAHHPLLHQRAIEFSSKWGSGAAASRVLTGSHPGYSRVESKLAALKGTERAMVLNSGYQANVSLLASLADRHSLILGDRLNHNSLIQGALLSRAKLTRFRHADMDHLRQLLEENREGANRRTVIVSESVFSMDGDRSDIQALVDLAGEFAAFLYLDEAHATGVLGANGMGLSCGKDVDLAMGTFSKACGAFGAYVACSENLYSYILNCCSGVLYSTALPPAVLGSIEAALELVPTLVEERDRLHKHAEWLRQRLRDQGWSTGASTTQIVPVHVGDSGKALELAGWLEGNGVLAAAIRPPTVPSGKARVRLCLSATHTRQQVEHVAELLGRWRGRTESH